jgi:hypothetical protein
MAFEQALAEAAKGTDIKLLGLNPHLFEKLCVLF